MKQPTPKSHQGAIPIDLTTYLHQHFYTRDQLLAHASLALADFERYQTQQVMPACSYKLTGTLLCHSFFGEHQAAIATEFYAKGYVSWLNHLPTFATPAQVKAWFKERYRTRLAQRRAEGYPISHTKLTTELETHLDSEWSHFLAGTYGLCTKSGLPEDIADKEAAVTLIEAWLQQPTHQQTNTTPLQQAVDLLDAASAPFAPHERERSSRHRLIDKVRRTYALTAPAKTTPTAHGYPKNKS